MENPLISVIIPVYNVERYLPRCLNSVICNTYDNLEIICVNDGSTDSSLMILNDFAQRDHRIVVIDQPNGGVTSARNTGVNRAKGEFVSFIDSDDWVHRQYFEILVHAWKQSDGRADVVMCSHVSTNDDVVDTEVDISDVSVNFGSWELARRNRLFRVYVWAKLYRRGLIGDFRQPCGISLGEDVLYNLCVLGRKKDVVLASIESAPLYYYYQRAESIVHATNYLGMFPAIQWMSSAIADIPTNEGRAFAWEVVLKHALSLRYTAALMKQKDPARERFLKDTMKTACNYLSHCGLCSKKRVAIYSIMSFSPVAYKVFRVVKEGL